MDITKYLSRQSKQSDASTVVQQPQQNSNNTDKIEIENENENDNQTNDNDSDLELDLSDINNIASKNDKTISNIQNKSKNSSKQSKNNKQTKKNTKNSTKKTKKPLSEQDIIAINNKKQKQWKDIIKRGNKSDKNCISYVESFTWSSTDFCLDCDICNEAGISSRLWTGTSCKSSDLKDHLHSSNKHKNAINILKTRESEEALNKQQSLTSDNNDTPSNYDYLKATFVVYYFIILYNIALCLVLPFNKLLNHFNIKNSGKSYVSRENGYEMAWSIYSVVKIDRKKLVSKSRWINVLFDESTTKAKPSSLLAIGFSFYNIDTHWKDQRLVAV